MFFFKLKFKIAYKRWLRKLRCINCLPADEIENAFKKLLEDAMGRLMMEKKAKGRRGTTPSVARKAHHKISKVNINASHSDVDALSLYERPDLWNNQGHVQFNTLLIKLGYTSFITWHGTFERWSDVAKKTERLVANQQEELAFGASPKKKRPKLMACDNRIKVTIKKHKQRKLDLEEYRESILQL